MTEKNKNDGNQIKFIPLEATKPYYYDIYNKKVNDIIKINGRITVALGDLPR